MKGREADEVRLYLPRMQDNMNDDSSQSAEEARIVFVGATRARKELKTGKGVTRAIVRRLEGSGRAFTSRAYNEQGAASVEIGRQGDIGAYGLAGAGLFDSSDYVEWAQERIQKLEGAISEDVFVKNVKTGQGFRYGLYLEENMDAICFLEQQVNSDMFEIAKRVERKNPPHKLKHQRIFGIRTLVLKPDDTVRETLHAPWCDSGFMLAPLLLGYSVAYFRD